MSRKLFNVVLAFAMLAGLFMVQPVAAQQATDDNPGGGAVIGDSPYTQPVSVKPIDQPNPKDFLRNMNRMRLLQQGNKTQADKLALSGTDRVLVVLVEFAGTDTFTWTAGTSHWDPLGIADPAESTGVAGDCSKIITETQAFTYSGPLHNQIDRPLSFADRSGNSIWTEDFSPEWFDSFMFKEGVVISYTRQDGSSVFEDFKGKSVAEFYSDLSDGIYNVTGDVIGWLPLNHSTQYYDTDQCPGARSVTTESVSRGGMIPGAGSARTLVKDALNAINAKIAAGELPNFKWTDYDQDGDGIIDRLWIVHSGLGEEDSTTLLNRTEYGEAAAWSHSSQVTPAYEVDPVNHIKAGAYIMMPENGGIGVFAHEYSHNLGSMDLYAYGNGETSAGFWTTMADDWTGFPIGFEPPSMDPMHLDWWGWLKPAIISDTTKVYDVNLGQASYFPSQTPGLYRAAKIALPDGLVPQSVPVWSGSYYWFGGKGDEMNSMMVQNNPIHIPAAPATTTLSYEAAYGIETEWDFLWTQISVDGGTTWNTLTNTHTTCTHDAGWIGGLYGFPEDMCAAGIGGLTDYNASFPAPDTQKFDLTPYAGKDALVRLWYMTDWGTTYEGPFIDNIKVTSGATTLLSDNAEAANTTWTYEPNWARNNGTRAFHHAYYVQWRNTNANGGYDSALGDSRWRYGPADTGMVVWYENDAYTDNEVFNYLGDWPSFGPKGKMLVVDSHPTPYRDPSKLASYPNTWANVENRSQMRNAAFTLNPIKDWSITTPMVGASTTFPALPAVSTFHDSINYYPGAELARRSPVASQATPVWLDVQWDAGVVSPSKNAYSLKAPGYLGTNALRFACSPANAAGALGCYWYPSGLGVNGSVNGDPADVNGQFGWHVQLVGEAGDHTWATVRIWNSNQAVDAKFTASTSKVSLGDTINYDLSLQNVGSAMAQYMACVPLNSNVEFVSTTSSSYYLMESCPSSMTQFADMQKNAPTKIGAIVWQIGSSPHMAVTNLKFTVKAIAGGFYSPTLYTTMTKNFISTVASAPVQIGNAFFLPVINK